LDPEALYSTPVVPNLKTQTLYLNPKPSNPKPYTFIHPKLYIPILKPYTPRVPTVGQTIPDAMAGSVRALGVPVCARGRLNAGFAMAVTRRVDDRAE